MKLKKYIIVGLIFLIQKTNFKKRRNKMENNLTDKDIRILNKMYVILNKKI